MRSKCQSIPGISTNDDLEHASGFGNLNIQFLQILVSREASCSCHSLQAPHAGNEFVDKCRR